MGSGTTAIPESALEMGRKRLKDYSDSTAGRRFSEFIFILQVMSEPQQNKRGEVVTV